VDKVVEAAIDAIRKAGATIVDPADLATAGKFDDSELEVLLYEFKEAWTGIFAPSLPMPRRARSRR